MRPTSTADIEATCLALARELYPDKPVDVRDIPSSEGRNSGYRAQVYMRAHGSETVFLSEFDLRVDGAYTALWARLRQEKARSGGTS